MQSVTCQRLGLGLHSVPFQGFHRVPYQPSVIEMLPTGTWTPQSALSWLFKRWCNSIVLSALV